jgi:plasmid stabilization system protein ParE
MTQRKIHLSPRASSTLLEIYQYSKTEFGPAQAKKYLMGFRKTLDRLLAFPKMGTVVAPNLEVRRFRCQEHWILYRQTAEGIEVGVILDQRQDFAQHLDRYMHLLTKREAGDLPRSST